MHSSMFCMAAWLIREARNLQRSCAYACLHSYAKEIRPANVTYRGKYGSGDAVSEIMNMATIDGMQYREDMPGDRNSTAAYARCPEIGTRRWRTPEYGYDGGVARTCPEIRIQQRRRRRWLHTRRHAHRLEQSGNMAASQPFIDLSFAWQDESCYKDQNGIWRQHTCFRFYLGISGNGIKDLLMALVGNFIKPQYL
jgi:hypothetical protein